MKKNVQHLNFDHFSLLYVWEGENFGVFVGINRKVNIFRIPSSITQLHLYLEHDSMIHDQLLAFEKNCLSLPTILRLNILTDQYLFIYHTRIKTI